MTRNLAPEDLLPHVRSMRKLALYLLADEGDAEDAVQSTLLRALEKPPENLDHIEPWLRTVLRNSIRADRRSAAVKDRLLNRWSTGQGSALELADPLSQSESVKAASEALEKLDEPYRTILRERFLFEKTPKLIAAEMGLPRSTVRTWLQRGLERLRDQLQDRYGEGFHAFALLLLGIQPESLAGASFHFGLSRHEYAGRWAFMPSLVFPGCAALALSVTAAFSSASPAEVEVWAESARPEKTAAAPELEGAVSAAFERSAPARRLLDAGSVPPAALEGLSNPDPAAASLYLVEVKVTTPEGVSWREMTDFLSEDLSIVATLESSPPLLPPEDQRGSRNYDSYGLGVFSRASARTPAGRVMVKDDYLGILSTAVVPPFYAGLYYRNKLLRSALLAPDTLEVVFTVPETEIAVQQANAVLRVVGPNGASPAAGFTFDLSRRRAGPEHLQPDGSWRLERLAAGRALLEISAPGYARHRSVVQLPAGATTDLGTIVLERALTLSGQAVDASGAPVGGVPLRVLPFRSELLPFLDRQIYKTELDGAFAATDVGSGTFLLLADGGPCGYASMPVLVHLDRADLGGVRLPLFQAAAVGLRPALGDLENRSVIVNEQSSGLPVWSGSVHGLHPKTLYLAPGSYHWTAKDVVTGAATASGSFELTAAPLEVLIPR